MQEQELEKILEDINENTISLFSGVNMISAKKVEKILRKRMNDGWIPVEERLPEGRTRVICQFDNGDIELLWQDWESDTESLTYWTDFDFMAEKKVIAWRPLPDPYQTERRR
ncbi:DUF551 domain-containing protein [Faecalicatena contorta]|uniref:DUF551 domain-containing protein n=1 Tax=Faecalicatena contorta TaxID=39482 RepID=UPI001960B209|nr:DUF551 domain-containing protein [Faecalicatena contorta]MBM6685446.1 DUF551 domain-containing protein [Faecalicatena contorta]MBM6710188.1 DUF551 domain-containing protein [Faecalicatena contorta]